MRPRQAPLRVAIIGAECTGKSTLAAALATRLPALHLQERLRAFCDAHHRTPRADEQSGLLQQQIAEEALALEQAERAGLRWVLCDSTPLLTALYSVTLFDDPTLLPVALAHQQVYTLTLWAQPDPVWEADGIQRDGPAARAAFHARLGEALSAHRIAHHRVQGDPDTRVAVAVSLLLARPDVESGPR